MIGKKSELYLKKIRSKAKMFEFDIRKENHIKIDKEVNELIILAISVVGDTSVEIINNDKSSLLIVSSDSKYAISFASIFFDAYFQSLLLEDMSDYLVLLSSVAYYYNDMIGSSKLMIDLLKRKNLNLSKSGLEYLIISILSDCYDIDIRRFDDNYHSFVQSLLMIRQKQWDSEESIDFSSLYKFREKVYIYAEPIDIFFTDICIAVFKKKMLNSGISLLPYFSGIEKDKWKTVIHNNKIYELWSSQILLGVNEVFKGKSCVIQMPTGTGKTASVAFSIMACFLANRSDTTIVVAPFRALCKEISDDLKCFFSKIDNIDVNEISDVPDELVEDFSDRSKKRILVLTPEKLLFLINNNLELIKMTRLIIFDEAHLFDDRSRGTDYELLISTINYFMAENTQKIFISAVIPNAEVVNKWANHSGVVVSSDKLKTSEKSIAYCKSNKSLSFIDINDNFLEEFYVPKIIEITEFGKKDKDGNREQFPSYKETTDLSIYMSKKLISKGSIGIFSPRKSMINSIIKRVLYLAESGIFIESSVDSFCKSERKLIAKLLEENNGSNHISKAIDLGVFVHHSGIPNGVRLSIEYALDKGLAKLVLCTSTLSQGVNLPIKYLLVRGVYPSKQMMKVRDFNNLIGRTARAGKHTEGTIILTEKIFGFKEDKDLNKYKKLLNLNNSEPCSSTLLSLVTQMRIEKKGGKIKLLDMLPIIKTRYSDSDEYKKRIRNIIEYYEFNKDKFKTDIKQELDIFEQTLESVEKYLFTFDNLEDEVSEVLKSTYGYYLASDHEKEKLVEIFNIIKQNISMINQDKKESYRKAMIGIYGFKALEKQIDEKICDIYESKTFIEITKCLTDVILEVGDFKNITKLIPREKIADILEHWIHGVSFEEILRFSHDNSIVKISGQKTKDLCIDDITDICLIDFSYGMLVPIKAIMEILEIKDAVKPLKLYDNVLGKIRYGLPNRKDIVIYELGFSDRVIAQKMGKLIKYSKDKFNIKKEIKLNKNKFKELLSEYPSYFTDVLDKL